MTPLRKSPLQAATAKPQWKVDWAMRWVAFGVDHEMAGKDLIDSVMLSGKITRVLAISPARNSIRAVPRRGGNQDMKSKGSSLRVDDWLGYGAFETGAFYMYQSPRKAEAPPTSTASARGRRLRRVRRRLRRATRSRTRLGNPAFHIHGGPPPSLDLPLSFGLLLNRSSPSRVPTIGGIMGLCQPIIPRHERGDASISTASFAMRSPMPAIPAGRRPASPTREAAPPSADLDARLAARSAPPPTPGVSNQVYEAGKAGGVRGPCATGSGAVRNAAQVEQGFHAWDRLSRSTG
jgi:lysyl-tRNA synthetase class 1